MERILKCVREIIRVNFPVNIDSLPSIFGRPIRGWLHGDREIIAENLLPAIVFDSEELSSSFAAFHAYQKSWTFSIMSYIQLDYSEDSTTMLHRITAMVDKIMRQHTKIWVYEPCFICGQEFLSPNHLIAHSAELDGLANVVKTEWLQRWNTTHQVQGGGLPPIAPTMNDADAYSLAYYRLYEGGTIASPTNVTYYKHGKTYANTMTNQDILDEYIAHFIQPVRFISFALIDNISYGVVPKTNNQYLRGSQIKVSAKEIDAIHVFGPNNV